MMAGETATVALNDDAMRWAHESGADATLSRYMDDGKVTVPGSMSGRAAVTAAAAAALRAVGVEAATGGGTAQQRTAHAVFAALHTSTVRDVFDAARSAGGTVRRLRAHVHGVTFRDGYPGTVLDVADGDVAELVPRPDNPHDPLCVEVHAWGREGTVMLGYLPDRRDDVRREIHALAEDRDVLGELRPRVSSAYPNRPGIDVVFDLDYDMDLFLRLLADAEAEIDAPTADAPSLTCDSSEPAGSDLHDTDAA